MVKEVAVQAQALNVWSQALVVREARFDEGLRFGRSLGRLGVEGEVDLLGIADNAHVQHLLLRLPLAEGPAPVQHLEEDDAHAPHVHLAADAVRALGGCW